MSRGVRAATLALCVRAAVAGAQQAPPPTSAPPVGAPRPAELFAEGLARYGRGEFVEAAEAFRRAYEASQRAEILFNLGRALEGAGRFTEALEVYRQFDREMPASFSRDDVAGRICVLERRLAPPTPTPPPPPPRRPPATTVQVGPPPGAVALLVAGGVALGSSLALGVMANAALDGCAVQGDLARCADEAALGRAQQAPGLAAATNVTLAVGLAAAVAGAAWWIVAPSRRPVTVAVGLGTVSLAARW